MKHLVLGFRHLLHCVEFTALFEFHLPYLTEPSLTDHVDELKVVLPDPFFYKYLIY